MCGIAGIFGFNDSNLIKNMTSVLEHRGPDDSGFFSDKGLELGHKRLNIIDLETGRQPIFNEDHSICLIYNGEIYNFRELRADLAKKGHRFSTKTDTEVVVHFYEEYGIDCLRKFNGMFAFALWDSKSKQLVLARDRYGIKPLYYAQVSGGVLFASEVKAIIQYEGVKRELDLEAVHQYLNLRYVPFERTLFTTVKKVLPAQCLVVKNKEINPTTYWAPSLQPKNWNEYVLSASLDNILSKSIERHMIADVPVGVYLSGGIDSSTILYYASKFSNDKVKTFCMGFGEPNDELNDARYVSEHFGTDHREVAVYQILAELPEMIWFADFPKRNIYPYYLARLARKHVKVILSGLGGDELFAGYDFRYKYALSRSPNHPEERLSTYLQVHAADKVMDQNKIRSAYGERMGNRSPAAIRALFAPFFTGKQHYLDEILTADFCMKMTYDFLPVDDTTSMAQSVETRVPFLDDELVDLAFTIPNTLKFNGERGKLILLKTMKGKLPEQVLKKPKQGFGPDTLRIFDTEMCEYAEQLLEGDLVSHHLIRKDFVAQLLVKQPLPENLSDYNLLWNLLALEIWHRIFISGDSPTNPRLHINKL